MKLLLLLLLSTSAYSFNSINVGFRFGTDHIHRDNIQTSGTGYNLQLEGYLDEQWGMLSVLGQSSTESNSSVTTSDASIRPEVVLDNTFLQVGSFIYVFEGLRLAGGLSYHNIREELNSENSDSITASESYLGPFFRLSYQHLFNRFLIGGEYGYTFFDKYEQSGFSLIFGYLF